MCREVTLSAAGDEGDNDVCGVAVEVLSASIVDRGGARVGVAGGELNVAQGDAGVEGGHDECGAQHVGMDVAESASFADRSYPAMRCSPIEPLAVAPHQDWAFVAFADGEVDRACRARHQGNDGGFVALADDPQCSVAALERQVLDVRRAGFGHAQPVEAEQHGQSGVGAVVVLGSEQETAEFTAIHRMLLGRLDSGTTHVLRRVGGDATVDVGEAVVATHRRQSPVDRRCCEPALFHRGAVDLDVGSGRVEDRELLVSGPLEVVAQVVAVRLQRAAAVSREECGSRHLGFVGRPRWIVGAESGVVGEQCGHGVLLESWDIHPTASPSPDASTSTTPAAGGRGRLCLIGDDGFVKRVSVVGNAGSGKSRLAERLAEILVVPHVELDSIHHLPGWEPITPEKFVALVEAVTATESWVIDGNYRPVVVDGPVWQRADTIVWLDLPRRTVMVQVTRRTLCRVIRREELWNGNREPLRNLYAWDPNKSIVRWAWTQHAKYRERFGSAMTSSALDHIRFIRLRSHDEIERWLASLRPEEH